MLVRSEPAYVVGTAPIRTGSSSAIALATPIGVPPPCATTQSTPAARARATAASATSPGTCGWSVVSTPAARSPRARAIRSAPSACRSCATSSTRRAPSSTSRSAAARSAPAPNTTRSGSRDSVSMSGLLGLRDEAAHVGGRLAVRLAELALDALEVRLGPGGQRGVVHREELEGRGQADVGDRRRRTVAGEAVAHEVGVEDLERLGERLLGLLARGGLVV